MIGSLAIEEQCRKYIDLLNRVPIFDLNKAGRHYQDHDFGDQLYLSCELVYTCCEH